MKPRIGIILGSDSDFPILEKGIRLLRDWGIPFRIEVSSAHRTPERTVRVVQGFAASGVRVIIAAAGGAAHLAGIVAAHTLLPVLAVPVPSALSGLDSLLSMVQMPSGIPVATFGIGDSGGTNAVLLALEILALDDAAIRKRLQEFRRQQEETVAAKSRSLQQKIDGG